jgi:hypothetical protein
LDIEKKYIWVINQDGGLVIGFDIPILDEYGGHPTLLKGAQGRIAGELKFEDGTWMINSRSSRYSYNYLNSEINEYLTNVKEKRFKLFFPEQKFEIVPLEMCYP